MIPKTIHYCWFGGKKLPDLAEKCIESWKTYCPDYEIIEWNESNFDINQNLYVKEAYQNKKYAFVTDFARLQILYKYGGIYMDTDVEIIQPITPFLSEPAFSGFESETKIPTGIMGAQKGNLWIKYLLAYYDEHSFLKENGEMDLTTNVTTISALTKEKYNVRLNNTHIKVDKVFSIYPKDYFCPKDLYDGKIKATKNTFAIHHFAGSWIDEDWQNILKRKERLIRIFGKNIGTKISAIIYNYEKAGILGALRKIKKSNRKY